MKTQLGCIPCILRQTIETVELATTDELTKHRVVNEILKYLTTINFELPPPVIGKEVYRIIYQLTGNEDPYKNLKNKYNALVLSFYNDLMRLVYQNTNPVLMAAKLAVAGNIIDFGAQGQEIDLFKMIHSIEQEYFEINDFEKFVQDLRNSKKVLYLADNAGEIVLDRLFIEILQRYFPELKLDFTVAVRGRPIINDATRDDAEAVGLNKIAQIIDSGDSAPATVLETASPELKKAFSEADLIISKGMGNYETLDNREELIYYLLKVKCPQVSQVIGAQVGSLVFKRNPNFKGKKSEI